jgi:hypothetical protein
MARSIVEILSDQVLVKELIRAVVDMVPSRHAFSLRFWSLLLNHKELNGREGDELDRQHVVSFFTEVLKSVSFMCAVAQQLDLEAAGPFRDYALAYSPAFSVEDHGKLLTWVQAASPGASPCLPLHFPSRLGLLQALKVVDAGFVKEKIASALNACQVSLFKLATAGTILLHILFFSSTKTCLLFLYRFDAICGLARLRDRFPLRLAP